MEKHHVDKPVIKRKLHKHTFLNDKTLTAYQQPKFVNAAQEMLCEENLSEEGFLGAQAVLLLNGIL